MRTPPPGTRIQFKKTSKVATPTVHPWGKAAVRVWSEKKGRLRDTPVRAAARAESRELYPEGKALARIRYFEVQRALPPAILPGVHLAKSRAKGAKTGEAVRTIVVRGGVRGEDPHEAEIRRIGGLARVARIGADTDSARTDLRRRT